MVEALDKLAKERGLSSRSQALERALSYWLREQERQRVGEEIEAYYRGRAPQERREDEEWTKLTSRAAKHLTDD